ncbi:hypothetical protein J4216_05530 [Candidatus Woesearchaeota archaeon]|nr:hypothetical protein [Candidatus Woesearchaeota archaeon]
MTCLVASLSTGKGTWGHVSRLVQDGEWEKIFLITNEFGKENYTTEKKVELIVINDRAGLEEIRDSIKQQLQGKLTDTEVAVNLISGSGKEHIALVSAILKLGFGIRLVAVTKDGVKEV